MTYYNNKTVIKHSVVVGGRKTSISLESAFWEALKRAGKSRRDGISGLLTEIRKGKGNCNFSSAIRVHLFNERKGE